MTVKISGAELEVAARTVGKLAHAEGWDTRATGIGSHAEGNQTFATGNYAHAEGQNNTTASGSFSHAEGNFSSAEGNGSHAEGNSLAQGAYSHAEGYGNSYGVYSHAGGYNGRADAPTSWARGCYAVAAGNITASRLQVAKYMLGATTNALSAFTLTFDGSATINTSQGTANVLAIPMYSNYLFELALTGRQVGSSFSSRGWVYKGLIVRDGASARMPATVTQVAAWGDATVGTVSISANTASNYLQIQVTPAASSMMVFFGTLTVTEMTLSS